MLNMFWCVCVQPQDIQKSVLKGIINSLLREWKGWELFSDASAFSNCWFCDLKSKCNFLPNLLWLQRKKKKKLKLDNFVIWICRVKFRLCVFGTATWSQTDVILLCSVFRPRTKDDLRAYFILVQVRMKILERESDGQSLLPAVCFLPSFHKTSCFHWECFRSRALCMARVVDVFRLCLFHHFLLILELLLLLSKLRT